MYTLVLFVMLFAIVSGDTGPPGMDIVMQSEYGRRIIKEQQIVSKSSQNPVDLIINLNNFEQVLVSDSQSQMKDFQIGQSRNIEMKQQIKQKIFLTKYQIQNLAEEVTVATKEKLFAQTLYEARKKLLQEESKFLPQMQAIRNDEVDKLNSLRKQIEQTSRIINKISGGFTELAHFLSKKPNLQEKSGFMSNAQTNDDLVKFSNHCKQLKEDIDDIVIENPYTMLISSFKPILGTETLSLIEQAPGILQKLRGALESSVDEVQLVSNEREELFSLEKSELKRDVDRRSVECEQIRIIFERAVQQEEKLNNEINTMKKNLVAYQTELEEIQEEIEKFQINYSTKFKSMMKNLELLRSIKVILNSNKLGYIGYLKQQRNVI